VKHCMEKVYAGLRSSGKEYKGTASSPARLKDCCAEDSPPFLRMRGWGGNGGLFTHEMKEGPPSFASTPSLLLQAENLFIVVLL